MEDTATNTHGRAERRDTGARERASRDNPRHRRTRRRTTTTTPTTDPQTSWRQRQATWNSLDWITLQSSLPGLGLQAFTDRHGRPHPAISGTTLIWPHDGALTTAARRDWSGRTMGSTETRCAQSPASVADAFAQTIAAAALAAPDRWDTCWTRLGEWWALRAAWRMPRHPAAREEVEQTLTITHEVCGRTLRLYGGWRLGGRGAQIIAIRMDASVENELLTLGGGTENLGDVLRFVRMAGELLDSWSQEPVNRRTLSAWAAATAGPRYGAEVPAQMLALYDTRRWREDGREEAPAAETVRDLAWVLACKTRELQDVERRTRAEAES